MIEGMFTHFARADETDRSPALVQLDRYLRFAELLEKRGVHIPVRHCSNSAGIIRVPEANLNVVRAGITIYGIYPSEEVERDIVKLTPAMELKSHVSYVEKCGTWNSGKLWRNVCYRTLYQNGNDPRRLCRWLSETAFQ